MQQQRRLEWPAKPVVARAYLDQLERDVAISAQRAEALNAALDRADEVLAGKSRDGAAVSKQLATLAAELELESSDASGPAQGRLDSLAETLKGIAESLG